MARLNRRTEAQLARSAKLKATAPRRALARLAAPFRRFRSLRQPPAELLLVPQDLRTTDGSFIDEIRAGQFGLAGQSIAIGDGTPFGIQHPSTSFKRRLHGFSWLRHLRAVREEGGDEIGRRFVLAWIARYRSTGGSVFAPGVEARRIMSWLTNAAILLEGAEARDFEAIMRSLEMQVNHLAASWRLAPDGPPRLGALTALMLAAVCLAGQDALLKQVQGEFERELDRQILPFGGHRNRNPGAGIAILLDLLPLRQCIAMREWEPLEALESAVTRLIPWLRYMRLGDGRLARFNGMSGTPLDELAAVLAYDDSLAIPSLVKESGYLRLERGATILIMDAGVPPPLELSGEAHAGCLSFELSSDRHVVFCNSGAAGAVLPEWHAICRSTASHSTLAVGGRSSSRLVNVRDKSTGGAIIGLAGPEKVVFDIADNGGSTRIIATHDGYLERQGVVHRRTLAISSDGTTLDGRDYLGPKHKGERLMHDLVYDIHFHIHPNVETRMGVEPDTVDLRLPNNERWRFRCNGARLSLEESTYLAEFAGPRQTMQIVLRGDCLDSVEVDWHLELVEAPD
ncbi:MAG: heparinase [Hyphomicrobiaceae bacterium]|nr:MAG: heparinase [Hyphomicrobiaceae bacterium]